jgi:putative transposase
MCRVLRVNRAGFYAWLGKPLSDRAIEDRKLLTKIRQFWQESGGVYGSRKIHRDLKEIGIAIGEKRVARIMREHRIRSLRGYKKRHYKSGKPSVVAPNRLQQQFTTAAPDQVWVTDITYIRTHEGWLYLAAVMDLYSRRVVGWSMQPTLARELVLDSLLMAVWRRRPKSEVILHSDQGVQFGSDDFVRFCRDHQLKPSMSRRGNCYDNAVAESFFSNLKKERIKKRIYSTRNDARSDVFDYIEIFYNQKRRHGHLNLVSPAAYEAAYTGRS